MKEENGLRETYEDLKGLYQQADSLSFLAEPLKKAISKASNICHINLFTDLIDSKQKDLNEVIAVVASQFK